MRLTFKTADIARLMQLCVLIGYASIATLATVMPFGADQVILGYRVVVLMLALLLFSFAIKKVHANIGFYLVLSFLVMYLLRLLFDFLQLSNGNHVVNIITYCGFVLIPVTAILTFNIEQESDRHLSLLIVKFGIGLLLILFLIQITGRGYNPWEEFGGETNRLALEKLNPITIGKSSAVVLIAGLTLLIHYRVKGSPRILTYIAIVLAVIVLLAANSRGPIVSVTGALLWLFFGTLRRSWFLLSALVAIGVYLFVSTDLLEHVIARFDFDLYENQSNFQRLIFQRAAIDAFADSPILGAFAINPMLPAGSYPHNLFIETAMALGMIGLILILILFLYAGHRIIRFYNSEHPLMTTLLVYYTLAFQMSGSLVSADAFFMLLGFACVTRRRKIDVLEDRKCLHGKLQAMGI